MTQVNGIRPSTAYEHLIGVKTMILGSTGVVARVRESEAHVYFDQQNDQGEPKCFAVVRKGHPVLEGIGTVSQRQAAE